MEHSFVVMDIKVPMLYGFVLACVLCSVVCEINPGDFVFPLENKSAFSFCTFQNGTSGRCTNASKCPNAHEEYVNGVNPTLCYFAKNEAVVCCVTEHIKLELTTTLRPLVNLFMKFTTTDYPEFLKINTTFAENRVKSTTVRPQFDPWRNEWVTDAVGSAESSAMQEPNKLVRPIIPSEQLVPRRKSVAGCEDHYSLPVPFKNPGQFHITIVGGQVTSEGEFPHMAALGWTNEENKITWRCGGALISHDYVLTAAHCTVGRTPPDIVRIGEKDLINIDTFITPQDFGVEKIIAHPDYTGIQLYHDIALIKLNRSVVITKKVRPACLWQGHAINFTEAIATGYGHTTFGGKSSNELLKVDLKIFNNDECSKAYESERSLKSGIVESQLCAGDSEGQKDTCQGDSGGPIQVSTMNERQIVYHIIGVTSFGKGCGTKLPGVYTRVSHYLDWIEDIVWN